MAAGLGFKTFTTGEVLTAADTNGYLMQGVLVFADAAARDAAITAPAEGQFAYLKDTDVTTYYTSSAWANLDTTGMVNPMTTTGDIIYSSSGSTPARLGIGTDGQVLTSDGSIVNWETPAAGGGMTLISTTTLSGTATTLTSIPQTYQNLFIIVKGLTYSGSFSNFRCLANAVTTYNSWSQVDQGTAGSSSLQRFTLNGTVTNVSKTDTANVFSVTYNNYTATDSLKPFIFASRFINQSGSNASVFGGGAFVSNDAITSIEFNVEGNTFLTGTVLLYGVS